MRNLLLTTLVGTCFLFFASKTTSAQSAKATDKNLPQLQKQVDSLFTAVKATHGPGAAVAIVRNGKILYKKGYGYANLEYDIRNTPSTVFHIASLSKQFTALSILLLAKEGKLSVD